MCVNLSSAETAILFLSSLNSYSKTLLVSFFYISLAIFHSFFAQTHSLTLPLPKFSNIHTFFNTLPIFDTLPHYLFTSSFTHSHFPVFHTLCLLPSLLLIISSLLSFSLFLSFLISLTLFTEVLTMFKLYFKWSLKAQETWELITCWIKWG